MNDATRQNAYFSLLSYVHRKPVNFITKQCPSLGNAFLHVIGPYEYVLEASFAILLGTERFFDLSFCKTL